MKSIKVYKLTDGDKVSITTKRPAKKGYVTLYQLIADPGKRLVNGDEYVNVIFTRNPDNWSEESIFAAKKSNSSNELDSEAEIK